MKTKIISHLPSEHPWKDRIQVFDSLDSTNTYALSLARSGAPEGTVVLARQQTAGRGRLGRSFCSDRDSGLYMSLILRPDCPAEALMHLTCATAVAACDAIERVTGLRPGIKWINDLIINKRKLAGILTELGFTSRGLVDYAVIGIGINVHQQPQDFPVELQDIACSLYSATGYAPELSALAAELMISLDTMRQRLLPQQQEIMETYKRDCITLGKEVKVIAPSNIRLGKAVDIETDGALTVEFPDGSREAVSSGEVSVRGLWDYV